MRTPTSTIWRTVVFAGAMLATPALGACKKSTTTPATTPEEATPDNSGGDDTSMGGDTYGGDEWDSYGDPCADRPRGGGEGGEGRGFVLS